MKVKLLSVTQKPEELMQIAAAVCTAKEPTEKGMRMAIDSGHLSITEHVTFTFYIHGVSRALLAQLTRHRIASYSVESQRYVNNADFGFIVPNSIRSNEEAKKRYLELMKSIKEFYRDAVESGIPKEDARFVLPNAATTNLVMTMNARELLHFLELRECNRAQWEIRQLAEEIRKICIKVSPALFLESGAPCRKGKCPEKRPCMNPKAKVIRMEAKGEC